MRSSGVPASTAVPATTSFSITWPEAGDRIGTRSSGARRASSSLICCRRQVRQAQALAPDLGQELGALGGADHARHALFLGRGQELLLGREELRAVEREQRLALAHRLAQAVGVELADPAADLERDVGQAALVVGHPAHRAHRHGERPQLRPGGGDADLLAPPGVEHDLPARDLALEHRHQVHLADRATPGLGVADRGVHRAGVVGDLVFGAGARGGRARRSRGSLLRGSRGAAGRERGGEGGEGGEREVGNPCVHRVLLRSWRCDQGTPDTHLAEPPSKSWKRIGGPVQDLDGDDLRGAGGAAGASPRKWPRPKDLYCPRATGAARRWAPLPLAHSLLSTRASYPLQCSPVQV